MSSRDEALGEHLIREGLIRREALDQALELQALVGGQLDSVLLDLDLATEPVLLEALSHVHNAQPVTVVELDAVDTAVARIITPRIAARFKLAPFRREGNRLHVAAVNPGDLLVEDELALLTDCLVTSYVAVEARLYELLARFYGVQRSPLLVWVARKLRGDVLHLETPPPGTRATPRVRRPAAETALLATGHVAGAPAGLATDTLRHPSNAQPELELSTEDLELFPTLRQTPTAPGATAAASGPPLQSRAQRLPTAPSPWRELALPSTPTTPEERLVLAAEALQDTEMREEIADVLLDFCKPYLRRRMILAVRADTVIGWRAEGEGVDHDKIREISVPLTEPSVFVGLSQGMAFWLGALPPMPSNLELSRALGGEPPRDCVILPVTLKQKTVCFLYGDNLGDGVGGVPLSALRRLAAKAALAFQVYLIKGKIRTL